MQEIAPHRGEFAPFRRQAWSTASWFTGCGTDFEVTGAKLCILLLLNTQLMCKKVGVDGWHIGLYLVDMVLTEYRLVYQSVLYWSRVGRLSVRIHLDLHITRKRDCVATCPASSKVCFQVVGYSLDDVTSQVAEREILKLLTYLALEQQAVKEHFIIERLLFGITYQTILNFANRLASLCLRRKWGPGLHKHKHTTLMLTLTMSSLEITAT